MATTKSEPIITSDTIPKGTGFTVRITVDEKGNVAGVENIYQIDAALFGLATSILHKWHFRTYKVNGKPERFNANISFRVQ